MARGRYEDEIIDNAGNALSGATVSVYNADTVVLATIYDKTDVQISNPMTSNSDGFFAFHANNGLYDIKIEKTSYTTQYRYRRLLLDPNTLEYIANKGVASGYCELGSDGLVPKNRMASYSVLPTGAIIQFGGSSAPAGWLICNGSEINRTTYADLYAIVGTTYGSGNGSTTFNLPDFRGRSPLGVGQGDTSEVGGQGTNRVLGNKNGAEKHTLILDESPSHIHQYPYSWYYYYWYGYGGYPTGWGSNYIYGYNNTTSAGGDQPHNNMQPNLTVNFIIKT